MKQQYYFWLTLLLICYPSISFSQNLFPLPSGNVGIGTITPASKLEVFGLDPILNITQNGFYSGNALLRIVSAGGGNYSGVDFNGYHIYSHSATGNLFIGTDFTPANAKLVIQMDGKVGIGTIAPTALLHLTTTAESKFLITHTGVSTWSVRSADGTSWFMGLEHDRDLFIGRNGLNDISIKSGSGNIGIGTSTPAQKLTVIGGSEVVSYFEAASSGYAALSLSGDGGTTKAAITTNDGLVYFGRLNTGGTGSESDIVIGDDGNVGIGTTSQTNYKLNVSGKIRANEIVVNTSGADFVFSDTYKILSLPEVEKYIKENNHLPGLNSAEEMKKNGMSLSETQTKLLQKIEELTIYIIEQNKKIELLENDLIEIKKNEKTN